jgi:hypothetical protein
VERQRGPDSAKRAARLARAKQAHHDLIGAVYRAQADALDIEAQAKRRLADEYDAAQERGEVAGHGQRGPARKDVPEGNVFSGAPSAADLGLSRKEIHEARHKYRVRGASCLLASTSGTARSLEFFPAQNLAQKNIRERTAKRLRK